MVDDVMGIGEYGRAVGLSVSALRFYDRVDVLVPAAVDARTGYRRYLVDQVDTGRLIARLRRIGVGVADLRALTGSTGADRATAAWILDRHLGRLEAGLRDARAELAGVRAALGLPAAAGQRASAGPVSVLEVAGEELLHALDAVLFALPPEGQEPDLHVVLFELEDDTLTVFATDRYRMASCTLDHLLTAGDGSASFAVPAGEARELRRRVRGGLSLQVVVEPTTVVIAAEGGLVVVLDRVSGPVPDLKGLLQGLPDGGQLTADSAQLLGQLGRRAHLAHDDPTGLRVAYLAGDPRQAGELTLVDPEHAGGTGAVPVDARYLAEAIQAGPQGRLDITLRGQHPVAIRFGDDPRTTSIVMPRRG